MRPTLQLFVVLYVVLIQQVYCFRSSERARLARASDVPKHKGGGSSPPGGPADTPATGGNDTTAGNGTSSSGLPPSASNSTSASNSSSSTSTTTTVSTVKWEPCQTNIKPFSMANQSIVALLQCAYIKAPVQYSDRDGPQIQLGLVKLPALPSDPSANLSRIGNLFVNPGGPGFPASRLVLHMAGPELSVTAGIAHSFDIIAMDPRGVGLSTPLKCDASMYNQPFPDNWDATTPDGFDFLFRHNRALGESCRAKSSLFFEHMDTVSMAQDLEHVRIALGSEPMNFFGQGYGAVLGQQYASMYPDKVRAMVFDGVVGRANTLAEDVLIQSVALDATMQYYFDEADSNDPDVGLDSGSPGPGENKTHIRPLWTSMIEKAGGRDLIISDKECDGTIKTLCRQRIGVSDLLTGAQSIIKNQLIASNTIIFGASLRGLAKGVNMTRFSNRMLPPDDDYEASIMLAAQNIACLDGGQVAGTMPEDLQGVAMQTRTFAANTFGVGENWQRLIGCTGWPTGPGNNVTGLSGVVRPVGNDATHVQRPRLTVSGTRNPVLVMQSNYDPVGSLVYAQNMIKDIDKAVLLTRHGLGHANYFLSGDCAFAADTYMVNLTLPGPGTVYVS